MIKSYKQIIVFLVKSAKKNADSKGINFNEEKSIKMHEAVLPLIIFYILVPLINFIAPAIIMAEIYIYPCFSHHKSLQPLFWMDKDR